MAETFQGYLGSDWQSPLIQVQGRGGLPPAAGTYLATDALSAVLWPGGSQVGVLAPAVAWEPADPAAAATFRISIPAAASAALDPGRYDLRVFVTRGSQVVAVEDTQLSYAPAAPAVAAYVPPRAYCTYADLLRYAPWIAQVGDAVNEAGLADLRVLARDWVERIVLTWSQADRRRLGGLGGFGPGFGPAPTRTADLTAAFDRGGLMPSARLAEINARYAVGLIGDSQLVPGVDKHDPYADKAAASLMRARQLMQGYKAYVSLATPPDFSDPDRVDLIVGADGACAPGASGSGFWPAYGYGYGDYGSGWGW